jgi:hypothetical protein
VDELHTAGGSAAGRQRLLPDGGSVGRGLVDHDRPQLPGHHHHDARAGNVLLASAAACLGPPRPWS